MIEIYNLAIQIATIPLMSSNMSSSNMSSSNMNSTDKSIATVSAITTDTKSDSKIDSKNQSSTLLALMKAFEKPNAICNIRTRNSDLWRDVLIGDYFQIDMATPQDPKNQYNDVISVTVARRVDSGNRAAPTFKALFNLHDDEVIINRIHYFESGEIALSAIDRENLLKEDAIYEVTTKATGKEVTDISLAPVV